MKKRQRKSTRPQVERKLASCCPCCSHAAPWVENTVTQKHKWRGVLHTIQTKVMECKYCPAFTTSAEQDAMALQLIRNAHMSWLKNEVARSRKALGFTIRDFDTQTSISSSTISRINKAEALVDASTEKLLLSTLKELITKQAFQSMARKPAKLKQHVPSWSATANPYSFSSWSIGSECEEETLVPA